HLHCLFQEKKLTSVNEILSELSKTSLKQYFSDYDSMGGIKCDPLNFNVSETYAPLASAFKLLDVTKPDTLKTLFEEADKQCSKKNENIELPKFCNYLAYVVSGTLSPIDSKIINKSEIARNTIIFRIATGIQSYIWKNSHENFEIKSFVDKILEKMHMKVFKHYYQQSRAAYEKNK
ncbi:MAG: hypothetical protein MHPSP_001837, partial [Paramarteilia canceri]